MSAESVYPYPRGRDRRSIWPGAGLALMLAVLAHRIIAWHVPGLETLWVAAAIGLLLPNAGWVPDWAESGLRWAAKWVSAAAVVAVVLSVLLYGSGGTLGPLELTTTAAIALMLTSTAVVAVGAQVDVRRLRARRGATAAAGFALAFVVGALGLSWVFQILQ